MANSEVRGESGAFLGREEFSGLSVFLRIIAHFGVFKEVLSW